LIFESQTSRIFKELSLLSAVANKLPNISEIKWLATLAAQVYGPGFIKYNDLFLPIH
jgi:hypothetical protein